MSSTSTEGNSWHSAFPASADSAQERSDGNSWGDASVEEGTAEPMERDAEDKASKEATAEIEVQTDRDVSLEELPTEKLAASDVEELPTEKLAASDVEELPTEKVAVSDVEELPTEKVAVSDVEELPTVKIAVDSALEAARNGSHLSEAPASSGGLQYQPQGARPSSFPFRKILSVTPRMLLLVAILLPLIGAASYGIRGYLTYNALRSHATDGIQHLMAVKTILTADKTHATQGLDPKKLTRASQEFVAAHDDFVQMRSLIDQSDILQMLPQYLPQYRTQIVTVRAASQIGIDIADIGQRLTAAAQTLAPKLRGPLLRDTHTPLFTTSDLLLVRTTLDRVLPLVDDMRVQSQHLSVDVLPVNAHQREQIVQVVQLLPQFEKVLSQGRDLLVPVSWLLGVDQPRTFLVQTMDRAELRPTGGFTGQYGELHVSNGRLEPFSLRDISLIEYAANSPTSGQLAPQEYRSWWPFANWGLRDSNLSADFSVSGQMAIEQYKLETNRDVDGVILFTPFLIEHILQITGPLAIPEYHETITSVNLEDRLHYYQLDNAGIDKQLHVKAGDAATSDRKRFTSLVAKTLMDHLRSASPEEIGQVAMQVLHDLKTRDLQVYVTNSQLQHFLAQYDYTATIDRSASHDGLYVVQANVSASKASQYVRTVLSDTVTLDATGGATHMMHLQLAYNQIGPVYGLDTYRDYVRVYVPPSAKFLGGNGFDTGKPLCGGPYPACAADSVYPHDELVCPSGQYDAGLAAPMLDDPYGGGPRPLDEIGPPTNFTSDTSGRAMFGGYVVIPKNCVLTVTLSWYVPSSGQHPYSLFVQRQAGTFPDIDLNVLPTSNTCAQQKITGLHFNGVLTEDTSFLVKGLHTSHLTATDCYPQPGV